MTDKLRKFFTSVDEVMKRDPTFYESVIGMIVPLRATSHKDQLPYGELIEADISTNKTRGHECATFHYDGHIIQLLSHHNEFRRASALELLALEGE